MHFHVSAYPQSGVSFGGPVKANKTAAALIESGLCDRPPFSIVSDGKMADMVRSPAEALFQKRTPFAPLPRARVRPGALRTDALTLGNIPPRHCHLIHLVGKVCKHFGPQ